MLGPNCEVAVEVTGNAFELYDVLSPHCARMVLANPSALKHFGSGQHTERVDAARLAKMMAMNAVPPVWVPPQEVREVRRLLQYRFRLAQQQVRCKNQAKAILRRYGHDTRCVKTPALSSMREAPEGETASQHSRGWNPHGGCDMGLDRRVRKVPYLGAGGKLCWA